MHLTDYLQTAKQTELASKIGVSQGLVSLWTTGARPVPVCRCVAIERATGGQVTRKDLRPDDWASIWPELKKSKKSASRNT